MFSMNHHPSWDRFLTEDIRTQLDNINSQIGYNYTPTSDLVLRFMQLDLSKIKVVILGQDPYKPQGVANGRAFQPSDLIDWSQPFRQVSLKNIVRAIYAAHNNITVWGLIPSYKEIVCEMETNKFNIKQPYQWFDSLEEQGVLFLNTALTCEIGKSNSHKDIWRPFTDILLKYISENALNKLDWFLWGKEAIQYEGIVNAANKHRLFKSRHPMMCTSTSKEDFLYNPCFRETMDKINWLG